MLIAFLYDDKGTPLCLIMRAENLHWYSLISTGKTYSPLQSFETGL